MAAYIQRKHCIDQQFHIGYNPSKTSINDIISIQLDGDELNHVLKNFQSGIPIALHQPVVTYYGDIAKFIVANW
jgi:hypothetical protein